MPSEITVRREVAVQLPLPASLQGLIDELTALVARPAIGPDSVVASIGGGTDKFKLTLVKPD